MDNPNKGNPSENRGKAGFLTKLLAKFQDKKLKGNVSKYEESKILPIEDITKWERLGKHSYNNDDERRLLLLHTYRERARKSRLNIPTQEWRVFKIEAIEVLRQAGFDEEEVRDDIEKWHVIDNVSDLNEQEKMHLEIHKQRQKALEKGQEET